MGRSHYRGGLSRKHIIEASENSLRRPKMNCIDLYQIHRWDFTTPLEATLEGLDSLVRSVKVRYLANEQGWRRSVTMQTYYNLIYREKVREMNPLCIDQGVALIPWSPLARGFFAGNRQPESGTVMSNCAEPDAFAHYNSFCEDDFVVAATVEKMAEQRGATPTQVACAWVLQAPGVTAPIIGAMTIQHLEEFFASVDIELIDKEVATFEVPYQPHSILGHTQPSPARIV